MPSIVGSVQINTVSATGVTTFGDTFYVSPKRASKTATGSGGENTGNFIVVNNGVSATNTFDPDAADSNNVGNA